MISRMMSTKVSAVIFAAQGTTNLTDGVVFDTQHAAYPATNAFDGAQPTFWDGYTGPLPHYIGRTYSSQKTTSSFWVQAHSSYLTYAPRDFKLQGYTGTAWMDIPGALWTAQNLNGTKQEFTFPQVTAWGFRLYITSTPSGGETIISDLGFESVSSLLSVAPSLTSVNEGQMLTYTITAGTAYNGTTLYYTLGGTVGAADFSDGTLSGSVAIVGGTGSFTKTILNDYLTEGGETVTVSIRTGSITGPIVATSTSTGIVDTSTTPAGLAPTTTIDGGSSWAVFSNIDSEYACNVFTVNTGMNISKLTFFYNATSSGGLVKLYSLSGTNLTLLRSSNSGVAFSAITLIPGVTYVMAGTDNMGVSNQYIPNPGLPITRNGITVIGWHYTANGANLAGTPVTTALSKFIVN